MLGWSELKQTRVYQEAKEEGSQEEKLKMVQRLLSRGLSVEEIAELVELSPAQVQQAIQDSQEQRT